MPQLVELPDGQSVEFPDGASPEQMTTALRQHFPQHFPAGGQRTEDGGQIAVPESSYQWQRAGSPLVGQPTVQEEGIGSQLPGVLGQEGMEIVRGAANTLTAGARTVDELGNRWNALVGWEPGSALSRGAATVDRSLAGVAPVAEEEQTFGTDLAQGVGNLGAMLAGGGAARLGGAGPKMAAAVGAGMGFGAEFDDAMKRSIERGDHPDLAFKKALAYGTAAMGIEYAGGAGRVLRKWFGALKPEQVAGRLTAWGVSKEVAKAAAAGFAEEAGQRLTQNLIVDEGARPLEGTVREGLVGAMLQGAAQGPAAGRTGARMEDGGSRMAGQPAADAFPPGDVRSKEGLELPVPSSIVNPPSSPVASFRGPNGENIEVETGGAPIEAVQAAVFRQAPGSEFLGVKGDENANQPAAQAAQLRAGEPNYEEAQGQTLLARRAAAVQNADAGLTEAGPANLLEQTPVDLWRARLEAGRSKMEAAPSSIINPPSSPTYAGAEPARAPAAIEAAPVRLPAAVDRETPAAPAPISPLPGVARDFEATPQSQPTPATITGSKEGKASEMPAEAGATPAPETPIERIKSRLAVLRQERAQIMQSVGGDLNNATGSNMVGGLAPTKIRYQAVKTEIQQLERELRQAQGKQEIRLVSRTPGGSVVNPKGQGLLLDVYAGPGLLGTIGRDNLGKFYTVKDGSVMGENFAKLADAKKHLAEYTGGETGATPAPETPGLFKPGAKVMVRKNARQNKLHRATVVRSTPDGITIRYKGSGLFETLPPSLVQEPNATVGRKLHEAQFAGLTAAQRKQAKADARAFDDLVRNEGWRFGWYDPQHDAAAQQGIKANGMEAQDAFETGVKQAMRDLGVPAKDVLASDSLLKGRLLPALREKLAPFKQADQQASEFSQATASGAAAVDVSNLKVGDVLDIEGEAVRVVEVTADGTVVLEDGSRFGRQTVEDGDTIWVERVDAAEVDTSFGPADDPFAMDAPESVEQQKARLAAEQVAAEAKRAKDKLAEKAAKGLTGTTGDLGQGDLLGVPTDLFAPPPPKVKAFGASNKLVSTSRAEELKAAIRAKLGRTSMGIDPTLLANLTELGAYYLEGGVRQFPAWSKQMIEDFGDAVRPWLRSVYEGARAFPGADYEDDMDPPARVKELAKAYATGATPNLERTGGGTGGPAGPAGAGDVQPPGQRTGVGGDGPLVGQPDAVGEGQRSALSDGGDLPVDAGQPGDSSVSPGGPGAGGLAPVAGERGDAGGSGGVDESRISVESQSDLGTPGGTKIAEDGPSVADGVELSNAERASLQKQVEGAVSWIPADAENIKASLPLLYPPQHEDVLKAERRFFTEQAVEARNATAEGLGDPKRGILFTNGTGTGKTYTGAGIVKRFTMQGKNRILIAAPNKGIIDEWMRAAPLLGLNLTLLPDTSQAGEGIVITTYANMRANEALLKRDFDLVVMDECDNLLSNEAGELTSGAMAFRKAANHPEAIRHKAAETVVGPRPARDDFKIQEAYIAALEPWVMAVDRNKPAIAAEEQRIRELNTRVVLLSATPFSYHKSVKLADSFLYTLPSDANQTGYNTPRGFDRLLVESFGYRMRTGRLTEPDARVRVDLMEMAFNEALKKKGAISGRIIDVPQDYSREFIKTDSELGRKIDEGFTYLRGMDAYRKYPELTRVFREMWDYNQTAQLLEALKMADAIPRIREHLSLGRKVILFHTYIKSAVRVHPFQFATYPFEARGVVQDEQAFQQEQAQFEAEHPEWTALEMPNTGNSLAKLETAFGPAVRFYNGTVSTRKRAEAKIDFQKDDSPVKLMVAQLQAGKAGVSLHDTTGKHPRVVMMAALPTRPTDAIQGEGRAFRLGVMTNAIYEYLVLHSLMERFQFGSRINAKTSTAENLALGNLARSLRDRFRDGYLNAIEDAPNPQQGIGGKQADRRAEQMSDFEKAISHYFSRMKKNQRNKSAEGVDYYATPEPLGLKMVEWARPRTGEHVLEPSAGHGAIGQWFPDTTERTFVEPSAELRSELGVKVGGGRIVAGQFEDLDAVNKYDVIVMNPPFGQGGSKAIQHLAKAAWTHLRDGGRIVALIPEGPAADAKFEKFNEDPRSAKLYVRRVIGLPTSVFERAGTSVLTRIVIIDRSDTVPLESQGRIDFNRYPDINEFFDAIKDSESIERPAPAATPARNPLTTRDAVLPSVPATVPVRDQAPAATPAPAVKRLSAAQTIHAIRKVPMYVAKSNQRVARDEYDRMAAAAKRHGGYWSSFAKNGAIPGFQFESAAKRDAFMAEINGPEPDPLADAADAAVRAALGNASMNPLLDPQFWKAIALSGWRTLRDLGQFTATKAQWAAAMVRKFGDRVRQYLDATWTRLARLQHQQANGVSAVGQGHLNQIEEASGHTNIAEEQKPLYDAETLAQGKPSLLTRAAPTSTQIRILGGDVLAEARRLRDVTEATQAAAVKKQSDNLWQQLVAGAREANPLSRWRLPDWITATPRARAFKQRVLHIAARLNPVGRDALGNFTFDDFAMRAGGMSLSTAKKSQLTVGDQFQTTDPLTGVTETLTLGPVVTTPEGRVFHQLLRAVDAATQTELYQHFAREYPELIWFLDMFIDPALAGMRQRINGIEVPVFNRFAAAAMMADADPNFSALTAYTPDVLVTRSLLGSIRGALSFRSGTRSAGRKYKSGTSREGGHVRDLLSGFNVRTWQMLAEKSRREWRQAVFNAATPIKGNTVPAGWVKLETGMESLWQAVKQLRNWRSPVDPATGKPLYPETQGRMADDGTQEWKAFFGEAAQLRGRQLMLPQALVDQLLRRYTAQVEHGALYRLGAWAVRNSTRMFLAMPTTYVANVLTNDLFTLEASARRIMSGLAGRNAQDLRFARELVAGEFWKWFPGLRGMLDGTFRSTLREVLPDNIFADQTALADVKVRMDEDPMSYLRDGEIGAAALQAIRYGDIDVKSKQRMAYAWLKAQAVTNARRAGLRGPALRQAVEAYMANPPMADRARAVDIAGFELLNYADTPDWLQTVANNDYSKLLMPFPRFGYHYLAKNAQRIGALRDLLAKVPQRSRADALADVLTFLLFPAGGLGVVLAKALGGDDDEDARRRVGTSFTKELDREGNVVQKPLPRDLMTVNRMNLSAWARGLGLGTEREDDFWLRVRNYPVLAMAGAAILAENDARKFGPKEGAKSYASAVGDLASDFFSLGAAARVPAKLWQEFFGRPGDRMAVDPYGSGVPLVAYVTDQTLDSLVPGSRQADLLIRWLDPVQRQRNATKDFTPGAWDAARVGHLTGLLDRMFTGQAGRYGPAESTLPAEMRRGQTSPQVASEFQRALELAGFNVRPVPRRAYERAVGK